MIHFQNWSIKAKMIGFGILMAVIPFVAFSGYLIFLMRNFGFATMKLELILFVAISVVLFLIAFVMGRNFAKQVGLPLIKSSQHLNLMAQGDFSIHVSHHALNRVDEFGVVAHSLDNLNTSIGSLIGRIGATSSVLNQYISDLSTSAREIQTTANQQSTSVAEIVATMENNTKLSEQVSSKTEDVAHLSEKTKEITEVGSQLGNESKLGIEKIKGQNEIIIGEIKGLADLISRINEVVNIIDNIADQTKLIAFNASLEASSAGEAGARFSVVASEIRRFANNVVDSTKEIKGKIEEIQKASNNLIDHATEGTRLIESGCMAMSKQEKVFSEIVDHSQQVAVRSKQISSLTKQQETAASAILTTLKEISEGIRNFVTATGNTTKNATGLSELSTNLQTTVQHFKTMKETMKEQR